MRLLEEEDRLFLPQLMQAQHMEWGRALFNIIQRTHDKADRNLKESPQVNDFDIRRDWRYRMGYVEALHDVLMLPDDAGKI